MIVGGLNLQIFSMTLAVQKCFRLLDEFGGSLPMMANCVGGTVDIEPLRSQSYERLTSKSTCITFTGILLKHQVFAHCEGCLNAKRERSSLLSNAQPALPR
jgi:hypothetical protein